MPIRIVKGLDIPIGGVPEQVISDFGEPASVALLGSDYVGLRPHMLVSEGDPVKLGQPLFSDRRHPDILFTAPASGVISAINRGTRRSLLSVVVTLEGDEEFTFPSWPATRLDHLIAEEVTAALLESGLWTAIRERPFNRLADPRGTPNSIFVTAMDSNPLAANPERIICEYSEDYLNGLRIIARLRDVPLHVCQMPGPKLPLPDVSNITVNEFSGPHPSGLVGTHIHYLDPLGLGKCVWHLNYQDIIAIGRQFTTGHLWTKRVVALGGPGVTKPRLARTRLGANLNELTHNELSACEVRVISGSILSGRRAQGAEAYLGRYHHQVTVIAEGSGDPAPSRLHRLLGLAGHSFSIYRAGTPNRTQRFAFGSIRHGDSTVMIPYGGYERVVPLDILPTQLLRALLVGDVETAEALGCLELDEEDLALCSFVCPAKMEYGTLLRSALNQIERGD